MRSAQAPTNLPTDCQPRSVLVIEAPEALDLIARLAVAPRVMVVRFAHLTPALISQVQPDCVALPLLRPGFDALQVVERLARCGYAGKICALTTPLPDRAMVEAELRAALPGATITVIELAGAEG